ncbi:phage tail length tape measure family protein [Brevundimonas phoenicis]|uniref:phage tail length tape measure family protein n=1 Tax=Brevundimonas sp. 2P05AE TaxID=3132272 RepID=UPI00399FB77E
MTTRQIAYRLKAEGKTELRRDQQEVAQGFKETYAAAEQGAMQATTAAEKLEKRYRAMAQAAQDLAQAQAAQARFNAMLGVQEPTRGSAAASASVFMQDDTDVRRVEALRAAIDPLTAANNKLNHELKEYQTLANAGKITTGELAQLQGQARVRFDETTAAIARNEKGLTRLALASRLNLTRQASDVFVTAAMGMNPAMIAIQQGPQILDALATSGLKVSASAVAAGAGLTALAAGVVLLAAAWKDGENGALAYERAATGVGRTAGLSATELRTLTVAAAENGEVSIKAARDMAAQYLATGQVGGEEIGKLIAITKDYAAFTGVDAAEATKSLAKAMIDPLNAGRDMTLQYGLLDQAQLRDIENMIKQGDMMGARKILLEELTRATAGHADKVGGIESAWDAAGRSVSDFFTRLGEGLYQTDEEKLARLQGLAAGLPKSNSRSLFGGFDLRGAVEQGEAEAMAARNRERITQAEAAQRQQAEQERRRVESGRGAREFAARKAEADARRAAADADRAAREAERERKEALQQSRREEDRVSTIDLEVARARQDYPEVQRIEDANAARTRERQLIDDGTAAEAARTKAMEEQQRLIEARGEIRERETRQIIDGVELEASRIDGLTRFVTRKEREVEVEARILAYRKQEKDLVSATALAMSDQAVIDQARATAAERNAAVREREWKMTLASASGNRGALRGLDRADWIDRQARQIESDKKLNYGEGRDQAVAEYGQLLRAQTLGGMREGVRGLIGDIRSGGIRDALSSQFDRAADRLLDKLVDGLFDMDWSAMLKGGSGGGSGGWLSKGFNFLFGRNAEGTDFWTGGPTWVGERGPELLDLPRGSRITENARSMDLMRRASGGAGQAQRVVVEVVARKGDAFEPEVVRISGRVVQQGMATTYAQSVETGAKAAPTAVADARAYKN